MCCSPPLYLLYYIWHTVHSQTSPTARYRFVPFQNSILFLSYPSYAFLYYLFLFCLFLPYLPIMHPVSTGGPPSNFMSKVNCALLVNIAKVIGTNEFLAHFNTSRLYMKQFLKQIMSSNAFLAKENSRSGESQGDCTFKISDANNSHKFSWCNFSWDWHGTGTLYFERIHRCCDVCWKNRCEHKLLNSFPLWTEFCGTNRGRQFLQILFNSARRDAHAALNNGTISVPEVKNFFLV